MDSRIQPRPTRAARSRLGEEPKASIEDRLLAAMERLLAQGRRFASLSVEKLCREAGISRATFYLHFRDRGELVARLMNEVTEEIIVSTGVWMSHAEDAQRHDVEQALVGMVTTFHKHHATLTAVLDTAPQDEQVASLYQDMVMRICQQSRHSLAMVRRKGLARNGTDDAVVDDLARMLVGYCIREAGNQDAAGLERLARSLGHIAAATAFTDTP